MKLATIHHVAIIVSDYEKSKDFYVNKLGFVVVRENFRKERNEPFLTVNLAAGNLLHKITFTHISHQSHVSFSSHFSEAVRFQRLLQVV